MPVHPSNPLIVQSDKSLLLDVHAERAEEARQSIMAFAELEKSPEHIHSYRISPLSLWNAASAGLSPQDICERLLEFTRYPVAQGILDGFADVMARYGKIRIRGLTDSARIDALAFFDARKAMAEAAAAEAAAEQEAIPAIPAPEKKTRRKATTSAADNAAVAGGLANAAAAEASSEEAESQDPADYFLLLQTDDKAIQLEIGRSRTLTKYLTPCSDGFLVRLYDRGTIKYELVKLGWPVHDEAPLASGTPLDIQLKDQCGDGRPFAPRDYQKEAASTIAVIPNDAGSTAAAGSTGTGYGVIVLPCGAGKTVVGMTVMSLLQTETLILTTNVAAVHQWMDELLDKTQLREEDIAEYTGDCKRIGPVTVATYQILTWRPDKQSDFPHFKLFSTRAWGLVIYDEVHLLPAPVFRVVAELQAVRRLGLTATLVREDGAEDAVFSLVGPKRYDVPWKDLEGRGWIAEAFCTEIRVDLPDDLKVPYAVADQRNKYRVASENPLKTIIVKQLIENHPDDHILVIGQYIKQLEELAKGLSAPLITGKTPNSERERLYSAFKSGEIRVIVVSKVANFAIDLPDASMAVQVSGSFGSRQEEAQRLGRILRPKKRNAWFYTVVSRYTVEEEFAANRQKFLAEQGYKYSIQHWEAGELV